MSSLTEKECCDCWVQIDQATGNTMVLKEKASISYLIIRHGVNLRHLEGC